MNRTLSKIFFCLSVLIAVTTATGHGGHSNTHRKQDAWGNYEFGYDITDPWGAKNYRKESGDGWGNKWGSYGIKDSDGRMRIVEYVADAHGFRAKIKTNEPGTANKDAADAVYNGPDAHGYSHSVVKSGHAPVSYSHGPAHYKAASYKHEPQHDYGHGKTYSYGAHGGSDYGHGGWGYAEPISYKAEPKHGYGHAGNYGGYGGYHGSEYGAGHGAGYGHDAGHGAGHGDHWSAGYY